ncbi:hypothetical protein C8J56DRAFT_1033237 [Mycena floridula]|nr:hypothetical protein C8J56DRAFT_1033237 [Mycena floridula]
MRRVNMDIQTACADGSLVADFIRENPRVNRRTLVTVIDYRTTPKAISVISEMFRDLEQDFADTDKGLGYLIFWAMDMHGRTFCFCRSAEGTTMYFGKRESKLDSKGRINMQLVQPTKYETLCPSDTGCFEPRQKSVKAAQPRLFDAVAKIRKGDLVEPTAREQQRWPLQWCRH